jgi:hypothetical protein
VSCELKQATQKMLDLKAVDFDIVYIIDKQ